jgi:hypothetical protein
LPALVIVLGMLGMMERDGVAVIAAYAFLVGTIVYFATFAGVAIELLEKVRTWWLA